MKINVIASGSKGNCTCIEESGQTIIIDAGISLKRVEQAMSKDCKGVIGVLVTHEHWDHVNSLRIVCNKFNTKAFMTSKTYSKLSKEQKAIEYEAVKPNCTFKLGVFEITPVSVFHDAIDPIGFIIKVNDKKIVYITDTGYVHSSLLKAISNAECYILESNHDPDVLMNSNRPFELIRRVLGDRGHLCNMDSAALLTEVIGDKTEYIIHAHISEECNNKDILVNTMKEVFEEAGLDYNKFKTHCAEQTVPFEFEV